MFLTQQHYEKVTQFKTNLKSKVFLKADRISHIPIKFTVKFVYKIY